MENVSCIARRAPLARTAAALARGRITIGFVGGSITESQDGNRWSDKVCNWFVSAHPGLRVNVENAAKGATGSACALFRVDRDIAPRGCDLIFWECAVNDAEPLELRGRLREGVLRKLLGQTDADVVAAYAYGTDMYEDCLARRTPETVAQLEQLAAHYAISSVNMGAYAFEAVRAGRLRWTEWLPDGLHPDHRGSAVYAEPVIDLLCGAQGTPSPRRALPPPLFGADWNTAAALDLDEIERIGPWRLNREYRIPTVERILFTASPDARLRFAFEGTGLVAFLRTNFESAGLRYRIDGTWALAEDFKPDWAQGARDLVRPVILASGLQAGRHEVELRPVWGSASASCGTDFALCGLGVLP